MPNTARQMKATTQAVPQTVDEIEAALQRIADLRAVASNHAASLETHITLLREQAVDQIRPVVDEIERLSTGVRSYCEARRSELTDGGRRKTVKFLAGSVSWRKGRTRVVVETSEAEVLTVLRSMRLGHFIRSVEEIDKAEMLRTPAEARRVPGISIVDGEETIAIDTKPTIEG